MMGKKKKYYVVWIGVTPGIYDNWEQASLQINGYPGAKYKSFGSISAAEEAYGAAPDDHIGKGKKSSAKKSAVAIDIPKGTISVDAACSGNPGAMEYQGVYTDSGEPIFHQGPFNEGTNNIGEFLALVHALAMLHSQGDHATPIYTDSRTAIAWVRNKKVKTTLKQTAANKVLFDLMDRGITWLKNHKHRNPILKWDTQNWGEIPADFGRK